MENAYEVSDPSDWLKTPLRHLGPVEAALRCQVCKDFFDTPMITSCSHTFCSLCIRRCLTTDGKCPTCRAQDQEIKLRPNSIVRELVDLFQVARPQILQLGKGISTVQESDTEDQGRRKRKVAETDIEVHNMHKEEGRRTRARCRSNSPSPNRAVGQTAANAMDEQNSPGIFQLRHYRFSHLIRAIDDGLIPCPICNARMKEEAVFSHLDIHNDVGIAPKHNSKATR